MSEQELYLSIEQLVKLCRDFQADCFDGFVSNDIAYIENWLKKDFKIGDCVMLSRYDLEPIEVKIVDKKDGLYYLSDGSRATKEMLCNK